jgi:DNA-binding NarL/FixJ family response regulator
VTEQGASGGPVPAGSARPVRVVLVDDHRMFRSGVRAELGNAVDVVGEAEDVDSAVRVIEAEQPDVVLLDVHLPGGGGRQVLATLVPRLPEVRFLALSVSDAPEDVISVIRAGARGYVTKSITGPELAAAVRRVADGDAVFSPRLAGFVLDAFAATTDIAAVDEDLDRLTQRERHLQGGRQGTVHLGQDGRDARVRGAPEAAAVQPLRAVALGQRPPAGLSRSPSGRRARAPAYLL